MSIIRGLLGGPKSQRFGIGLAAAFGWDGRLLQATSGRPGWRPPIWKALLEACCESFEKCQKPKGLGLGLAAAFALGDTASWLGIWIPCLKGPPRKGPQPKVQKPEGLGLGLAAAFALGCCCCVLVGDLDPCKGPQAKAWQTWARASALVQHPEPSISVLKNRIFNWDPGRSWGPLIWAETGAGSTVDFSTEKSHF